MTTRSFYEIHFTGEGFRTLGVYRMFYRAALQRLNDADAKYDADVRDWYENGDGRPRHYVEAGTQPWFDAENDDPSRSVNIGGKGYRYPECKHGTSLWTDYDNICGACEDGSSNVELAISEARTRWLTFVQFFEWMTDSPAALPDHIRKEIADFSVTLFPKPIG